MPAYATLTQVNDYLGMVLTAAEGTRHITRAMSDVDAAVGPYPLDAEGNKFDPTKLLTGQAVALRKATCVQVEYRLQVGESFMIEDQYESRGGRNYSSVGKLRKISPAAMSHLHAGNLLNLTVGGGRYDPNWLPNQNNA